MRKRLFFLAAFVCLQLCCLASGGATPVQQDWVLDTTINQVSFYHKIIDCNGRNTVLLRIKNANNTAVKISWREVFTTVQEHKATEGEGGAKELLVQPGEISGAGCTDPLHKKLVIQATDVSPTYVADITSFSFAHIKVSVAN